MSYAAAIDQLNAMVPELYTSSGQARRKFSLDEIRILLDALGLPHRRFPSVLIAGTNGKGSTAATLASILTASGVRTGLYTSPHLERANERIRVGGDEISDDSFARHFFCIKETACQLVAAGNLPQRSEVGSQRSDQPLFSSVVMKLKASYLIPLIFIVPDNTIRRYF